MADLCRDSFLRLKGEEAKTNFIQVVLLKGNDKMSSAPRLAIL